MFFVLSHLIIFKQIAGELLSLPDSETVDVNPVVTQARNGGDAGRVPDCRPPGRVAVVVRDENVTKYFPSESQFSTLIGRGFTLIKTKRKARNVPQREL